MSSRRRLVDSDSDSDSEMEASAQQGDESVSPLASKTSQLLGKAARGSDAEDEDDADVAMEDVASSTPKAGLFAYFSRTSKSTSKSKSKPKSKPKTKSKPKAKASSSPPSPSKKRLRDEQPSGSADASSEPSSPKKAKVEVSVDVDAEGDAEMSPPSSSSSSSSSTAAAAAAAAAASSSTATTATPDEDEDEYNPEESDDDEDDDDASDEDDPSDDEENASPATDAAPKPKTEKKKKKKAAAATKTDNSLEGNESYDVVGAATWKPGKPIPYLALATLFSTISETTKRLEKIRLVSDFMRTVLVQSPEQLLDIVYLMSNTLAPAYEGVETGVGDGVLTKAICEATGSSLAAMRKKVAKVGDLGLVAESSRTTQRTMFPPPPLEASKVLATLRKLATIQGKSTQATKKSLITRMLVSCRGPETRYIVRALQGNLRIGLAETTVIKALARMVVLTPPLLGSSSSSSSSSSSRVLDARKSTPLPELAAIYEQATEAIKHAYTEVPSHSVVVPALLEHGWRELDKYCVLTPGVPIKAMLGRPAKGIEEVFSRFGEKRFTLEFKYDGERAQVHRLADGTVRIFSRNSEDHTGKYPDIVETLHRHFDSGAARSFIIDCEVVAYDTEADKILPFQTLSKRKRKAVSGEDIKIQVCLFAFDMMCLNDESFMRKPFAFRRAKLHETFHETRGSFHFAHAKDTSDLSEIKTFLDLAIKSSCEGLMVKTLDEDALYVPNKRNWLKIKKDYLEGLGDTLDLVPIGAYVGKGKRTGTYGAYLLACYDADSEEYQSICKIGTGFKDEDLATHTAFFKDHIIDSPPSYYNYPSGLECDVWFSPVQVWEVLAADLSISPAHRAAIGVMHESKGIALRFPRFMRIRPDKKPEDATTSEQVVDMFQAQSVISG